LNASLGCGRLAGHSVDLGLLLVTDRAVWRWVHPLLREPVSSARHDTTNIIRISCVALALRAKLRSFPP